MCINRFVLSGKRYGPENGSKIDSPMNSDYYTPHRTTLGKATIRELLDTLNGKKEFPYEILQEYNPLTYKRSIF